MNKVVFLLFAGYLGAQTYVDCPSIMATDTVYGRSHGETLLYFNAENSATSRLPFIGPVDLDMKATSRTLTRGDTFLVSVRGFKRKILSGTATWVTFYGDSTYMGTVLTDSLLHTFMVDTSFAHFPIFDGLSVRYYKNGTDADSGSIWMNLRVMPGVNPR